MKQSEYKDFLLACKQEAVESRVKLKRIWKDCWEIYRNEQDYSDKENWQSQICIPEGMSAVRKAQGIIRTHLTRTKDFFNVEHGARPDHIKLRIQNKFRDRDVNFITNFVEGIGVSLVFGVGIIKHIYREVEKTFVEAKEKVIGIKEIPMPDGSIQQQPITEAKIEKVTRKVAIPVYEVKDPRTTYFLLDDPYKFVIEEEMFPLSEVLSWADKPGYDKTAINKLKKRDYGDHKSEEIEERLRQLGIIDTPNEYRKMVLVQTYYGDVTDDKGNVVHKNVIFSIANQEYLIMPPKKNPYWHGKIPFVIWSPISVILRKTGQSMLEGMRTIQRAINNIVNLQIDALIYELLGIPQVDTGRLLNPAEVTVLKPGRLIRLAPNSPGPAITIERPPSFSNAPIHMVEFLRRAAQNSHFVTDILMGLPTVKGEQATATEIAKKGSEAAQAFQVISMDIEDNALVPLLEMTASNILQFDDFSDVNEPELMPYKAMTRAQRLALLQGPYRFTARGITSQFEKQEMLYRIVELLNIVSKVPIAAMAVKWPRLLQLIFENSQLPDAETLVYTEEEVKQMMAQQMIMQQQMMNMKFQSEERDRQADLQKTILEGQNKLREVVEKGIQQLEKEKLKSLVKLTELSQNQPII
jgi:hypothetical protein